MNLDGRVVTLRKRLALRQKVGGASLVESQLKKTGLHFKYLLFVDAVPRKGKT